MSLFGFNKKVMCPVTPDDKLYVEQIFQRLILHFGFDKFMSSDTITPDHEIYKSKNVKELVENINKKTGLIADGFETDVFEDHQSSVWLGINPMGRFQEPQCFIESVKEEGKVKFKISLAK